MRFYGVWWGRNPWSRGRCTLGWHGGRCIDSRYLAVGSGEWGGGRYAWGIDIDTLCTECFPSQMDAIWRRKMGNFPLRELRNRTILVNFVELNIGLMLFFNIKTVRGTSYLNIPQCNNLIFLFQTHPLYLSSSD